MGHSRRRPQRIGINPGDDNAELKKQLKSSGLKSLAPPSKTLMSTLSANRTHSVNRAAPVLGVDLPTIREVGIIALHSKPYVTIATSQECAAVAAHSK